MQALLCHEHRALFTSHPCSTTLWVWLSISQLSSFCRKQAQSPTQVTRLLPCSGVGWELGETLDPRPTEQTCGNDGVCTSALCLYILHLNTWHHALYTGPDFLNVESDLIVFCMQLDVLVHAYPLRNYYPCREWIYPSPPQASSCPFEIAFLLAPSRQPHPPSQHQSVFCHYWLVCIF